MKGEERLQRLEECLQKTAPPVMVFAEKTRDVDMVHEALLLRDVNAVAIHGARPHPHPPPPFVGSFPVRSPFLRRPCARIAARSLVMPMSALTCTAVCPRPRRSAAHCDDCVRWCR